MTVKHPKDINVFTQVNGVNVKGKALSEAIPLLKNSGSIVKLKLTRVVTIPERDFQRTTSFRLPPKPSSSPLYVPPSPQTLSSSPEIHSCIKACFI